MEAAAAIDPLIFRITVFVLAVFVGYYVVWQPPLAEVPFL